MTEATFSFIEASNKYRACMRVSGAGSAWTWHVTLNGPNISIPETTETDVLNSEKGRMEKVKRTQHHSANTDAGSSDTYAGAFASACAALGTMAGNSFYREHTGDLTPIDMAPIDAQLGIVKAK